MSPDNADKLEFSTPKMIYQDHTYWIAGRCPSKSREGNYRYYINRPDASDCIVSEASFPNVIPANQAARCAINQWLGISELPPPTAPTAPTAPASARSNRKSKNKTKSDSSCDRKDLIDRITESLAQREWTSQDGQQYLKQQYNKSSRQQLSDAELIDFLQYLQQSNATGQKPPELDSPAASTLPK